jgi:glucosylceramidase
LRHFSRFIKREARRIVCTSNSDEFVATAFHDPDGKIAVVLTNLADHAQTFQLWVEGRALKYSCPAHGVVTLVS